jgi:hypothetical protein
LFLVYIIICRRNEIVIDIVDIHDAVVGLRLRLRLRGMGGLHGLALW